MSRPALAHRWDMPVHVHPAELPQAAGELLPGQSGSRSLPDWSGTEAPFFIALWTTCVVATIIGAVPGR